MNFDTLRNEVVTTLKICKREEEAEDVIVNAHKKLLDKDISSEKRFEFWKEIYERLGERDFSLLEEQAKSSVDRIVKIARERIKKIMEKEKEK